MDRSARLRQGSIPRLLLDFSLPAIVGMLAQGLYYVIDRIFVGMAVHSIGITGITDSFPMMLVIMAFAMLIGFGAAALISIRLGERNKAEAEQVLGNALVLLVIVAIAITATALPLIDQILVMFGASEAALPFARDYLGIILLGAVFQMVGFGLNAAIRGEGNPRVAMASMLISVFVNLVLAPLFIFVFGWGMKGAALATVLAQAVTAVWVVAYFLSSRSVLRLRARNLWLDRVICARIVMMGLPLWAMQIAGSVLQCILNNQLLVYGGDMAISMMGILYSVMMMIVMPIIGINQGAQPIIGYNHGAQQFDRVKKTLETAILAASGLTLFGFATAMVFPAQVVRLFISPADPDLAALLALGTRAIRIALSSLPIVGFQAVSASYFQAVGKPKEAMLLTLSRQVLLLIPAVLILPHFFGLDGVWAAIPTADILSSVITGVCLFFELRHLRDKHSLRTDSRTAEAAETA